MGGSDATDTTTGWQLAQSTDCFGWSRLAKPNTQKDPPTSTRAELLQARKQPLEGRSWSRFPRLGLQLCSDTEGNTSKAWDGQQWDRGCCSSPGTHLGFSACESQSPVATALLRVFPGIPQAWKRLWLCPRSLCLPCAAPLSPRCSQQSPPGALSGVVLRWHLAFPFTCVCVCTPRAFQVPLGVLEASEHIHCTPKFSFCLPLHPRALPGPSSTSGNSESLSEPRALQAPLPAPWVSPWVFLSPHLDFWAPWGPPCAFPCIPVPSV